MPIRNIIVDWGSGRPPGGNNEGKYKNRKQYCQEVDAEPIAVCRDDNNVTCTSKVSVEGGGRTCTRNNSLGACEFKGTMFGNSPDACDPGYYEFIGAYAFDAGDNTNCGYTVGGRSPNGLAPADLAKLTSQYGLKPGHRYCAFKPRVIIIDNWGWCNGTDAQGAYKGYWGNPDPLHEADNICVKSDSDEYVDGLVGTKFNGWVVVAEQK